MIFTFRLSVLSSVCSECSSLHIFSIKVSDISSCWPAKSSVSFTTPKKAFWKENLKKKIMYIIWYHFSVKYHHAFIGPVTLLCMLVWTITKHFLTNRKWKRILLLIINNSEPLIKKAFSQSMIKKGLQTYWSKTFEWLFGNVTLESWTTYTCSSSFLFGLYVLANFLWRNKRKLIYMRMQVQCTVYHWLNCARLLRANHLTFEWWGEWSWKKCPASKHTVVFRLKAILLIQPLCYNHYGKFILTRTKAQWAIFLSKVPL